MEGAQEDQSTPVTDSDLDSHSPHCLSPPLRRILPLLHLLNEEGINLELYVRPHDSIIILCLSVSFLSSVLKTGVISSASGSAYVEMESSKVMCAVYGPRPSSSGREFSDKALITCEYKYTTWSNPSVRRGYQPDDEEKESAQIIVNALQVAIRREAYPKSSIDINILVLQDAGGALAAAMTCACLALMDAGVQMYHLVSACHIGVSSVRGGVVLDPEYGDVRPTDPSITMALMGPSHVSQFIQSGSVSSDQLTECIDLGVTACQKLQQLMTQHMVDALSTAAASLHV
jgi:exosome complex component MTR3